MFFGELAKFEGNLIRERTNAGLIAAKARGWKGGCPKGLDDNKRKLAVQLHREDKHPINEICQMMGVSSQTGTATCGMEHDADRLDLFKRPCPLAPLKGEDTVLYLLH